MQNGNNAGGGGKRHTARERETESYRKSEGGGGVGVGCAHSRAALLGWALLESYISESSQEWVGRIERADTVEDREKECNRLRKWRKTLYNFMTHIKV